MAIWSDIAHWRGPTPNRNAGGTVETRGVVVHIAEGTYEGTISWQKNASAEVSSHFVVDRDGTTAQMVDTADKAWTQIAGNGHWISVECAGFSTTSQYHSSHPGWEVLTPQQISAIARILVKAHQVYGVPLQIATSPSGKGLGHHSMGGTAWGHLDCPGNPIIAQKPAILAAATNTTEVPDMDANQANQLQQVYGAVFAGGGSMGASVPDPVTAGGPGNSVVDLLQHIRTRVDAIGQLTLTDAQVTAIADRLIASGANGLTSADHTNIVADVKAALRAGTGA